MEEGQERDSSSDEQRHIIDDDDMEDSPTDSPDLWMSERNEADTMFERALRDAIPSKKHPQAVSGAPNDLDEEYSHLSKWQGVGKQAEVVGNSRSPRT
jgi:hypothetical protein